MGWKDTIEPQAPDTQPAPSGWRNTIRSTETPEKGFLESTGETVRGLAGGIEEGFTLGFASELKRPGDYLHDLVFGDEFGTETEKREAREKKTQEKAPIAHMLGDVAGSMVLPIPGATGIKGSAKVGATLGGLEAAGRTEDLVSLEGVSDIALGAGIGGILGGAIPVAGKALDKLKRPVEVPVPVQTPIKQEDAGKMFMDHEGTWKRVLKVKDDGRPTSKGSGNFYTLEGVKDPIHADEKGKLTIGRMIIEGKAPPNVPPKEIAAPKKSIIPELATSHGLRKEGISLTKAQQIEDLRNPEAFDQLVKSGSELKVFKSSPTKTFHAIEDKKNEIGQALDKASKKMDNLLTEDEMASSIALHTEELVNKITKKATAGEYTKAQGDKFQDELMEQLDNLTKNIADGTPIFQSIRKIRQGLGKRLRSSDYQGAGPLAGAPKERLMEQVQLFRTLEGDLADKASTRIGSLPESQQKAAGDYLENMKKYSDLSDLGLLMGKTATKNSTATIEAGIAGTAGVLLGGVTGGALGAGGALLRQYLSTSEGKFQLASLLEKGTPTAKQIAKFAKESGVKPTEVLKYLRNQVGMLGGMITEKDQTGE